MWAAASNASTFESVVVERVVYLMGTRATLAVEAADRPRALERLEELLRILEQTEAELSTWRDDSVLSSLNRQPIGAALTLPPFLCGLWPRLIDAYERTDGAFDPTIGAWVEAWGLRSGGREPTAVERKQVPARTGLPLVRFDERRCTVIRDAEVTLDAGAFGKGAALGRLPAADAGESWLIDLGGQVAASGPMDRGPWTVTLARPDERSASALELSLDGGSLATSGISERSWEVDGRRVTHVLDPRTGTPVVRDETVTVWHADPLMADMLSTALYVMGAESGLTFAKAHDLAAIFLIPTPDGGPVRIRVTEAFRQRFGSPPNGAFPRIEMRVSAEQCQSGVFSSVGSEYCRVETDSNRLLLSHGFAGSRRCCTRERPKRPRRTGGGLLRPVTPRHGELGLVPDR